MIRYILRRLLWMAPTLFGTTVLTFLLLSFVPDPAGDPALAATLSDDAMSELRRSRFLDLPRFVNLRPRDLRSRVDEAVSALAAGEGAEAAARELSRLGGAALPLVLPSLDAHLPEPRRRIVAALAPVGERMRLATREALLDPGRAASIWTRYWDDRSGEFRRSVVRTRVQRLARHGSALRQDDLLELDTFVLPELLGQLETPRDAASLERARRLIAVAAHVTGRADRIGPGDGVAEGRACVERWREFWFVQRTDYVALAGTSQLAATLLETQYARWATRALTLQLGVGHDGTPVADKLRERAPFTAALVLLSIVLAYSLAIPLGALAAWRTRREALAVSGGVLLCFAIPSAVAAAALAATFGASPGLALPTLALAAGLVAPPALQLRSSLQTALSRGHAVLAWAKGAGTQRVAFVHVLREALVPVVTLAACEPPIVVGGAFVVERVFGVPGLGEETIRAVLTRDVAWLMAIALAGAVIATVGLVASDLVLLALDPRIPPTAMTRRATR